MKILTKAEQREKRLREREYSIKEVLFIDDNKNKDGIFAQKM